ncbi:MAG: WhiB family transcriptional regulator [Acidimicrobiales bacterium]
MVMTFNRSFDWDESRWRDRAACRGRDPDVFFPVGSTGAAVEETQVAKQLCGPCLVREECLQFALKTNQESGIWGGTTEDERRRLRGAWLARQRRPLVLK